MFRELGDVEATFAVSYVDHAEFLLRRGEYGDARPLMEAAVARARELDEDQALSEGLLDLGSLELHEHRHQEAVQAFSESLTLAMQRGLRTHLSAALRGLAVTLAAEGQIEPAARAIGKANSIEEETGWRISRRFVLPLDAPGVLERAADPEIAASLAAGEAMSDVEAVAYALAAAAVQP